MKKIILTLLVLTVAGSAVFCAAAEPNWLTGESKKYPKIDYFTGVGVGHDMDSAKGAARAEISKIFSVTVQQTSKDFNKESTSAKGEKKQPESEISTETETTTSTGDTFEGIEIADTWYNRKTKSYYAFAVLSKSKLKKQLAAQISDLEENIQEQIEQGQKNSSNIEKVKVYSTALRLWDAKDKLNEKRRIVDTAIIPDLVSGYSKAKVKKLRDNALNRIFFVVETEGRPALNSVISNKLSEMGFKLLQNVPISPNRDQTVIVLKCAVEVAPMDRGNPTWKFYNWQADASMNEVWTSTGSFATIAERGEASHLNEETAKSKAYIDADRQLALTIEKRIKQNIFGE